MMLPTENHEEIRQYLLGSLPQEAQQGVEERLLIENSFLEELVLAEEELTDDYINNDLSDDYRLRFEQHFLSTPERRRNLRFALALSRYAANSAAKAESKDAKAQPPVLLIGLTWAERLRAFWNSQTWALRAAVTFGVIAILAGALWLSFSRPPSPRTFATLSLTISVNNRAEGVQASKVKLPLNADALKISLTLPEQSPSAARYQVELLNDKGETKPLEIAGQEAQAVSVLIPAALLARGQYALKLFMIKADGTKQRIEGSYYFTVE